MRQLWQRQLRAACIDKIIRNNKAAHEHSFASRFFARNILLVFNVKAISDV